MKPPTALLLLLLTACKPEAGAQGMFSGPPPFMPNYPGGEKTTTFYELPGCAGEESAALFVRSVRVGEVCVEGEER